MAGASGVVELDAEEVYYSLLMCVCDIVLDVIIVCILSCTPSYCGEYKSSTVWVCILLVVPETQC
jgi:hypothetical protein